MNFKILVVALLALLLVPVALAGNLSIKTVELSTYVFYPGDVVDATVTVENKGSLEQQYRFEYIVGNELLKAGDVRFIQGNSVSKQVVPIEIPDDESFKLTVRVKSMDSNATFSKTYLVSSKVNSFSLVTDKETVIVAAGNDAVLKLTLKNRGTDPNVYNLDITGWPNYTTNSTFSIDAAKNKTAEITFHVPESTRADNYPIVLEVCDLKGLCKSKSLELVVTKPEAEQSLVSWDENQTTVRFGNVNEPIAYEFNITNLGSSAKDYVLSIEAGENLTAELSEEEFTLAMDETMTIALTLTPTEKSDQTAKFSISAEGTKIFSTDLSVEYAAELDGITGMFIGGIQGIYLPGLIALAFIGAVFATLLVYRTYSKKLWTEKVVSYEKKPHPAMTHLGQHPRSQMGNIYPSQYQGQPQQPVQQQFQPTQQLPPLYNLGTEDDTQF